LIGEDTVGGLWAVSEIDFACAGVLARMPASKFFQSRSSSKMVADVVVLMVEDSAPFSIWALA